MMSNLKHGDPVRVWPKAGLRVQAHPDIFGRFIPAEGEDLVWSDWLHDRFLDGSIHLHDPSPIADAAPAGDDSEKAGPSTDGPPRIGTEMVDGKGELIVDDPALPAAPALKKKKG